MSDESPSSAIRLQELIPAEVAIEPNSVLHDLGLSDRVEWSGTKLIVPEGMTPDKAKRELQIVVGQMVDHLMVTCTTRHFDYPYADLLIAVDIVLKREFDVVQVEPGSTRNIPTGFGRSVKVEAGSRTLPDLNDATVEVESWGTGSKLHIHARRDYDNVLDTLFETIQRHLDAHSIYRGQAIDASFNFLDLTTVNIEDVIYNTKSRYELETYLWGYLEHTAVMRLIGRSLKRAILLSGDFGTGKTLTGHVTAQIAVANGWAFIMAKPGQDDLDDAMALAILLQPAVLYFEDIDTVVSTNPEELRELLDETDGLDTKNIEVITVMTTNHPNKLVKGQLRPGRLDAHIELLPFDPPALEQLVYRLVPGNMLLPDIDYVDLHQHFTGMSPSFVGEAIQRSVLYGLHDSGYEPDSVLIGFDQLKAGAEAMAGQQALMDAADAIPQADNLTELVGGVVSTQLADHRVDLMGSGRLVPIESNGHR